MQKLNPLLSYLVIFISIGLVLFASCAKKITDTKQGGTLIFGVGHAVIALDPGTVDEDGSSAPVSQICESLLRYKPGTTELEPWLAEKYTFSADGKELVFTLREGVKFHDGTSLNAEAVVFSLARQHYKDHPYHKFGPWKHWLNKGWSDKYNDDGSVKKKGIIKDVIKVDDITVKITLTISDASIIENFGAYWTGIVSPTAFKNNAADFKKHPVGTGPFKFTEWIKDDHVTIERNSDYWNTPALLNRIIFKVYPDETARTMALKKGEVDIIDAPGRDALQQLKSDENIKIIQIEGHTIGYVCMNVEKKPFNTKLVRQALCHAINKKEIIDAVYGELGTPAEIPLPRGVWGYNTSITGYEYSPEKAKELLKKAGYANGFSCELLALPVSRPYNPNGRKVGEIIQAQLAKVGIQAKVLSYEIGTYWDKIDAGEFDLCMTGWSGTADPDNYLFELFTHGYLNSARWYNDSYISLVTDAKQVMDKSKREEIYKKAQELLHEEAPILMLANGILMRPMQNKVHGWIKNSLDKFYLERVWLTKE